MSCILYSRASYRALAKNPLFRHVCQRDFNLVPEQVTDAWFNLNIQAFKRRYDEVDPVASGLAGIDHEFNSLMTGKYTDLYRLMGRIDYQLADGEFDRDDANAGDKAAYADFLNFRDRLAYTAIEKLAPYEPVQIPNNAISLMDMISTGKGKR